MSSFAIALILAVTLPLALHLRGASPARMFGLSALAYLCLGAGFALIVQFAPRLLTGTRISRADPDTAVFHDTYYVVPEYPYLIGYGLLMLILTGLLSLQQRRGAIYRPRLMRWLFWPLVAPLFLTPVLTLLPFTQMPRVYADYPDHIATISRLHTLATLASLIALVTLVALGIGALIRRARKG